MGLMMTSHFEANHLISQVALHGAYIYADAGKVRIKGGAKLPQTLLEQLKERRDEVLAVLTVPRLPWQLERLVNAASSGTLILHLTGVPSTTHYVMACACAYLTSDKEEALKRLWEVYNLWQTAN
jgi:hypothetical protein